MPRPTPGTDNRVLLVCRLLNRHRVRYLIAGGVAANLHGSVRATKDVDVSGRDMDLNYDHPILLLQLLLWHEGYHHRQIKLALKLAGHPISNDEAGPLTWDIWRKRR